MADVPDRIDLKTHRDLESWVYNRPIRYVILSLVGVVIVLGLLNVFGQRPSTTTGESSAASLEVFAPEHLRGGIVVADGADLKQYGKPMIARASIAALAVFLTGIVPSIGAVILR